MSKRPHQLAQSFGSTERVEMLRKRALEARPFICGERARYFTEAYRESESEPPAVRKALALARLLEKMTIYINEGELVVGNNSSAPRGSVVAPEYGANWLKRELNDPKKSPDKRAQDRHLVEESTRRTILDEVIPYWLGKTIEDRVLSVLPPAVIEHGIASAGKIATTPVAPEVFLRNGFGHVIVDYERLLRLGYPGSLREAQSGMEALDLSLPGSLEKRNFLRAVTISYRAAIDWVRRYARLAEELREKSASGERRQELQQIADDCRAIAENPPATFRQALQCWFFAQLILFGLEQNTTAVSPGRFDQYMFPFYQKDLGAGIISRDEALELLQCLFIKLSEMSILWDFDSASYWSGFSMTLCLVVGGVDERGNDATNDLSHLVLEADRRTGLLQPETAVRVHSGTPHSLLAESMAAVRIGRGKPKFFMDSAAIAMLQSAGVGIEEARDYGVVGCVELTPSRNTAGNTGAVFINLAKCLEAALNNGRCLLTDAQIGPATGRPEEVTTFPDLRERFEKQVRYAIRNAVIVMNAIVEAHARYYPCPFTSSLLRGCLESGVDFTAGGAQHSYIGMSGVGLPNVANSLLAIKKAVFEQQKLTLSDLVRALKDDYRGQEQLRLFLWNKIPKYGNDDDEVDLIAQEVGRFFCREMGQYKSLFGHCYRPGLFAVSINVPFGLVTGATAEGRQSRRPLADGGISPCAGSERQGMLGVIKSATKIDNALAGNGTLLNIRLLPLLLDGENGMNQLINVLRAYESMGGYHIQFNVVDDKTLREAQRNPEEFRGLMVRVAGYSAYFVELNPEVQEDIISRTMHCAF